MRSPRLLKHECVWALSLHLGVASGAVVSVAGIDSCTLYSLIPGEMSALLLFSEGYGGCRTVRAIRLFSSSASRM